jgi:GGDEF domain-containing protein
VVAALDEVPAARGLGECAALVRSAEALRLSAPELAVQLVRRALVVGAGESAEAGDAAQVDRARSLALRANAVLAGGLVGVSRYVDAVEPALTALAIAEGTGDDEFVASVRLDLAACAREVGEPLLGCALLRPVLEAPRSRPSVRAVALGRLVDCIAHLGRRDDVEDTLAEADRLLGSDDGLNPDVRRIERVRLSVRAAAYHRWYGDTEDTVDAAREGLGQLNRLRGSWPETTRLRAQLVLELTCALLDEGELGEAEAVSSTLLDEPVRATSAAAMGQLMLAVSTRILMPSGRVERGRLLLDQAVLIGHRHGQDDLLADALTTVAQLDEQAGHLSEALQSLRGARSAEQRRLRATATAARQLLVQVGTANAWDATEACSLLSRVSRHHAPSVAAVSPISTAATAPATNPAMASATPPAAPPAASPAAPPVVVPPAPPTVTSVTSAATSAATSAVIPATHSAMTAGMPAGTTAGTTPGSPAVTAPAVAAAGPAARTSAAVPVMNPAVSEAGTPTVPTGPTEASSSGAAEAIPATPAAADAPPAVTEGGATAAPSETDRTTGLLNREGLYRRLHAVRNGERPVALTLARLVENDACAGVNLTDVAGWVRELAPDNAELACSDGTELAVILPSTTKDQAEQFARTIRDTALRSDWLAQANAQSLSTGVGQSHPDAPSVDAGALLTSARDVLIPAEPPHRPGERTWPVPKTALSADALNELQETEDTLRIGRTIIDSLSIPEGSGGKRRAETGTFPKLPGDPAAHASGSIPPAASRHPSSSLPPVQAPALPLGPAEAEARPSPAAEAAGPPPTSAAEPAPASPAILAAAPTAQEPRANRRTPASGDPTVHGSSGDAPLPDQDTASEPTTAAARTSSHSQPGQPSEASRPVGETGGYRRLVNVPPAPEPPTARDTKRELAHGSSYEETKAELARLMTALEAGSLPDPPTSDPPPRTTSEPKPPPENPPEPSGLTTAVGGRWSFAPVGERSASTRDRSGDEDGLTTPPSQSIPTPPEPDEVPEPPRQPEVPEPDLPDPIPTTPPEPEPTPPDEPQPATPPPSNTTTGRRDRRGERTGDSNTLAGLLAEALVAYQETRDDEDRLDDLPPARRDPQPTDTSGHHGTATSTEKPTAPAEPSNDGSAAAQPAFARPGEVRPGEARLATVQPGDAYPGAAQPGVAQPGHAHPADAKPGAAQPGEAQPGEAQPGEAQPGNAQPGNAQPGDAQSGEAQSGEAQSGEAQSGDAQPGDAIGAPFAQTRAVQPGDWTVGEPDQPPRADRAADTSGQPARAPGAHATGEPSLGRVDRPAQHWSSHAAGESSSERVERPAQHWNSHATGESGHHRAVEPDRPIEPARPVDQPSTTDATRGPALGWIATPGLDPTTGQRQPSADGPQIAPADGPSADPTDPPREITTASALDEALGSFDRLFDWRYQQSPASGRHRSPE